MWYKMAIPKVKSENQNHDKEEENHQKPYDGACFNQTFFAS
jgi:hypothetical protein